MWGWETGASEPADIVVFRSGAPVTVQSVKIEDDLVTVYLWDEFANPKKKGFYLPDPPSTSFTVQLPAKFSKDFRERETIDKLINTVLTFTDPGK